MAKTVGIVSAIVAFMLAGCEPPKEHIRTVNSVADVEELFDIDLCAKSEVISAAANPFAAVNPSMAGGKEFVIGFPDKTCVEDFFRVMKSDRGARDVVDGQEYFRIIGGWGKPPTLFTVDRVSDTRVMLRLL